MAADLIERWFCAVLVFESRVEGEVGDEERSVDIQYRLVRAVDGESAYQRALALGRREKVSYLNDEGMTCEWVFAGLKDLKSCDGQLEHGAEIYGFIEAGVGEEHVVEKAALGVFMKGGLGGGEADGL